MRPLVLLDEIEWGAPVVPPQPVPEMKKRVHQRLGGYYPKLFEIMDCVPWTIEAELFSFLAKTVYIEPSLANIVSLAASQSNSCRYCYGTVRAVMQLHGFTEAQIDDLERKVELADERTRAVYDG